MTKNSSVILNIAERLRDADITPSKRLGQNFLVNSGVYRKIVDALDVKPDDNIIEIGPGLGFLTEMLSKSGANVIAVEKDRTLAAYLKRRFENQKNVIIEEEDILKFDPRNPDASVGDPTLERRGYKAVGNIPYYLTSHLIGIMLQEWPSPERIVLMVQKEVAQRINAKVPDMNLLAVTSQYFADVKKLANVSRGSFYPSPNVDSAIIKLEPRKENEEIKSQAENFLKIVRAGFSEKRKQLINTLSKQLKLSREKIGDVLNNIGIDPRRRAETLSIEEWKKITTALSD